MKKIFFVSIMALALTFNSWNNKACACEELSTVTLIKSNQFISTAAKIISADKLAVSTSEALEKILKTSPTIVSNLKQSQTISQNVYLQNGEPYLFAAASCPRISNIGIKVKDSNGQIVHEASGKLPSVCFSPSGSDNYSIEVTPLEMADDNESGAISAILLNGDCNV